MILITGILTFFSLLAVWIIYDVVKEMVDYHKQ